MSLPACPDCGSSIGKTATKCRCGWKSPQALQTQVAEEKKYARCVDNQMCRYPGRLWLSRLAYEERLCVDHYYEWISKYPECAKDETVPQRTTMPKRMLA
jgi:hypothetical protein